MNDLLRQLPKTPFVKQNGENLPDDLLQRIATADPQQHGHYSVMLREILLALAPKDGGLYLDGTFGAGGYSRAIVATAECTVFGVDRDPTAHERASGYPEVQDGRIRMLHGCFGDMDQLLAHSSSGEVNGTLDGIVLDIGVSSMQLDQAERGFSFQEDGPLDMRMEGPSAEGRASAADVVNTVGEKELADIIYTYGEEKKSRHIARAIVEKRAEQPFSRTTELADLVRSIVRMPAHRKGKKTIDPATRTFQALRIHVNDELGELERGLAAAERLLKPSGRLVVVSFHSLEDRIVKNFMRERSGDIPQGSRHGPAQTPEGPAPTFRQLSRKALEASEEECSENPRSRSAKLRAAERTDAPSPGRTDNPGAAS